ncbi:MAG: aspartate/glutamate/uridylate kinase [Gallionellaceae bacterium]|nr:aspartate/glutamate/uridylate kinase [Gallionellaceae bacterium]
MLRVVKLGGSLLDAPRLPDWLEALSGAGGQVVVVPGGGPYADAVRITQARLGFSDATAHRMALLAMEQYGLALCDLHPGLLPAASSQTIAAILERGRTPVWQPAAMCLQAPDIPEAWSVTSDSLAAWLAGVLDADALALIKHGPDGVHAFDPAADRHRVDTAFAGFAAAFGRPVGILGHDDPAALGAWLAKAKAKAD